MLCANFGHNAMDYSTDTPLSSTFASATQNRFVLDGLTWLGWAAGTRRALPAGAAHGRAHEGDGR